MRSIPSPGRKRNFNFENAVEAFLQREGLPFSEVINAQTIASVFAKHSRSVCGSIYTHAIVVWAFLSQVLRDGKEASCQSAVARIIAHLTLLGRPAPSADTGDYCRARAKLPEAALKELTCLVASNAQEQAPKSWLWKQSKHTKLIDGFTFMMPDTAKNQGTYPQHSAQKPGLGFPIARVTAIISLATGCVLAATIGPFSGKETGETALLRRLMTFFSKGDVVVADRYFCCYWLVALLIKLGVNVCFRKVVKRHGTFTKSKRLGKNDYLYVWHRPLKSSWMTKEFYDSLPTQILIRQIEYIIDTPGRKQQPFVIVTTMLQPTGDDGVSYDDIAQLYWYRWNAELDIRSIKTFMNLHHVRCKSPHMVHREFWVSLLAYNLIRVTIASAAEHHQITPRQISFVSACQFVLAAWQELPHIGSQQDRFDFCLRLLKELSKCLVGNRPGRFEPRVNKKRKDKYRRMMEPREALRLRLEKGDNLFEL